MLDRITCPFHRRGPEQLPERTPSLVLFEEGWYHCFSCEAHGRNEDLGVTTPKGVVRYVEDVAESLKGIRELPVRSVRGLELHSNDSGYYVVWPDDAYFKYRPFHVESDKSRYRGPSGVKQPLFAARQLGTKGCIVVEGEINALSIAKAIDGIDVFSPGGATSFYGKKAEADLLVYKRYERIILIADNDPPGAIATIELKAKLMPLGPRTSIHLMEPDANDWLVEKGQEALKAEIEKYVGV